MQRAWKAYQQGNVALADDEFSRAIEEEPQGAFALLQRGLYQLQLDRFAEASVSFEAAAAREAKNPAPLFFLCLSREMEGEPGLADAALEKLANECPHHQGLASLRLLKEIRRGNPLPVLQLLGFGSEPAARPSGAAKSREGSWWQKWMAGLGKGDPQWIPPDLSSSQYLLGPILLEVERRLLPLEIPHLEHRQEDLMALLDNLKPPDRKLSAEVKGLGKSFKGGAKLRKGRQVLEKAMGIENLDEQIAELRKAIALLEEGHALDPYAFRTGYHMGEAYLFSAKSKPGTPYQREPLLRAEECFLESARLDGLNPYVLFYLALVQHLLGRPQPAIDCYARATEKFTKLPEAHYGAGQCYLLLGDARQAREMLLRAVNSDLALARERLSLFTTLLEQEGASALALPLPQMPPPPDETPAEPSTNGEPPLRGFGPSGEGVEAEAASAVAPVAGGQEATSAEKLKEAQPGQDKDASVGTQDGSEQAPDS